MEITEMTQYTSTATIELANLFKEQEHIRALRLKEGRRYLLRKQRIAGEVA